MKRICLSLGLGFSLGLSVSAQEPAKLTIETPPAASLGAPRKTSLGVPRPASTITPATTSPISHPLLTPIVHQSEPLVPLLVAETDKDKEKGKIPVPEIKESESKEPNKLPAPKSSPGTTIIESPTLTPGVISHPVVSLPAAQCDSPGCTLPSTAMPFVAASNRRVYASSEYLMWWMKSYSVPILATTGPVGSGGVLGQPGVVPVLGGGNSDPTGRGGARFNIGYWFGPCQNYAIDASFFFLGSRGTNQQVNSNAFPLLARPFIVPNSLIDPNNEARRLIVPIPGQFAETTAFPGQAVGSISLHTESQFWGGDLALRRKLFDNGTSRLDGLVGYRHLDLKESLEITETFMGLPGGSRPGVSGTLFDRFETSNSFNGLLVGLLYERQRGRWNFGVNTRLGLGVTNSMLSISGGQAQFGPNAVTPTVPGGLLALNSNIGNYSHNRLTFVPEIGLTLGYDITPRLQVTMGYNFMYWSNVLRPGDQIDTTLDLTRVPILNDPTVFPPAANVRPATAIRPTPQLRGSDLWIQGMSWGLKYVW